MFLALILAATTAAAPSPPSLASLRVIANVRSTPVCSAMRTKVGPTIAALLENDATLDLAPARFDRMYRDALLAPTWDPRSGSAEHFINLGNLEALIGPLVKNLKQVDDLLADKIFDDARLAPVKSQLEAVEAQQKDALNVISGYDATSLTFDILTTGKIVLAASQPSARIASQFDSSGFFGGAPSPMQQGPRSSPGRMDVSLGYNPYRPFAQSILDSRAVGSDAESVAASTIEPIAESCRTR